jgi:2Fe-2S ferredoxin
MPRVAYITADGHSITVDVAPGTSLMEAAVAHGVDGIVAECGGNAMCATCHVYVDPAALPVLPVMMQFEDEMLDLTVSPRAPGSRLSCQLVATEAMDGLVVRLPDSQV